MPSPRLLLLLAGLSAVFCARASAQATSYLYEGDTLPTVGTYADWFTTVGPGHPTGYFFEGATWTSNGSVLAMNTLITPSIGIWFGRTDGYSDPSNFSLANTADGNLVRASLALAPSSSEWSLYWYDASGYGSSFYLHENGFNYYYLDDHNETVAQFRAVPNMTSFHTFTSYVLAGQVSYFFDGQYLGGGAALQGASNFLVLGDGTATDVTGYGTLLVDSLEIITAVSSAAPGIAATAVPEPATYAALAGLAAFGLAAHRRCRPTRIRK